MKTLTTTFLITALSLTGIGIIPSAAADEHRGPAMPMIHGSRYGMHHAGAWQAGLNETQRKQIAKLKLDYQKKTYPLNLSIKRARLDLAKLLTTDKPDQKAINNKIDAIIKLKAEAMHLKVAHKIEIRKVLKTDQRVLFDTQVLNEANHDKRGRFGHH